MASAAARALDAADGVIDGRYYGRPIVQAPSYSRVGVGGSYLGGAYRGAPVYGATTYGGYAPATSTAAALDAADGVIDGKYFGRPIVQGGGVPAYATRTFAPTTYGAYGASYAAPAYGGSSALALDAADGVIDGKFYGRPIVGGGAAPVITRSYAPATYGGAYGGSSALALDAADGVIDGKFYGRQIVNAGPGALVTHPRAYSTYGGSAFALDADYGYGYGRPAYGYGGYGYGGYSTSYTPSYAAAIPAGTYANSRYVGRAAAAPYYGGYGYGAVGRTYGSYAPVGAGYSAANSTAAALDAADGVIDGRYYGRPIVGA